MFGFWMPPPPPMVWNEPCCGTLGETLVAEANVPLEGGCGVVGCDRSAGELARDPDGVEVNDAG